MSLSNVKRVEVIRGLCSAMYGVNAYLGVINIITKKRETFASFNVGEFKKKNAYGSFYKKIGNTHMTMFAEVDRENDFKYRHYQDQVGS
jgi:iron complex outermembrane receptor protein